MHHPLVKQFLRIATKSLASVASAACLSGAGLALGGAARFSSTGCFLHCSKIKWATSMGNAHTHAHTCTHMHTIVKLPEETLETLWSVTACMRGALALASLVPLSPGLVHVGCDLRVQVRGRCALGPTWLCLNVSVLASRADKEMLLSRNTTGGNF